MIERLKTRLRKDEGFSLVEILVVVMLATIIVAAMIAAIITTQQTSDKFSSSTVAQESLTNSVSTVARDLAVSPKIIRAEDFALELINGSGDDILYLYYDPAHPSIDLTQSFGGLPAGDIPLITSPSFISVAAYDGNSVTTITVLVTNVNLNQTSNGAPLFTYFNADNVQLLTPVGSSDLVSIKRIAIRIITTTADRAQPLEIQTSVAPNVGIVSGVANKGEVSVPASTVLTGVLPPRTQTATLKWVPVAGEVSYDLSRDGSTISNVLASASLSKDDANLAWGSTHQYYVTVNGAGGAGPQSNAISLTVVPEKPAFININPAAACNGNTVARGLTNCLAWSPRAGALGYRLYKDGVQIYTGNATTYSDAAGITYGGVHVYTVVAYNSGQNGSGGDSLLSNPVTLYSPPIAPVLSGTTSNGTRNLSWTAPANSLTYTWVRTGPTTKTITGVSALTASDPDAVTAATFTYAVQACNNAGCGPASNSLPLYPNPGAPAVSVDDYVDNPGGRDGNNFVSWSVVPNTQTYNYQRNSEAVTNGMTTTSKVDYSPGVASTNAYRVQACNITGCGGWTSTTGLQPPGPFALSNVTQQKRQGHDPFVAGSQDNYSHVDQSMTISWGGAAGASSYYVRRDGGGIAWITGTSLTDGSITPGYDYTYGIAAIADNGASRAGVSYNFQVSPATMDSVGIRPQTSDGNYTRDTFWGAAGPRVGVSSGTQYRATLVQGPPNSETIYWDTNWSGNWDGNTAATEAWYRSWSTSGYWFGGLVFLREYSNIPSGFSAGNVSQTYINPKGTGINIDMAGNVSWTEYVTFRTYGGNTFNPVGSPTNDWHNVPYSSGNYPSAGGRDWEGIVAY